VSSGTGGPLVISLAGVHFYGMLGVKIIRIWSKTQTAGKMVPYGFGQSQLSIIFENLKSK
jgi:hypothetical protein